MSLDGIDKKIQWNLIPWEYLVHWTHLYSNFILDLLYFLHTLFIQETKHGLISICDRLRLKKKLIVF